MVLNPPNPPLEPISHQFPETLPSPDFYHSLLCSPQPLLSSLLRLPPSCHLVHVCPSLQSQPSPQQLSLSFRHLLAPPRSTTLATLGFCSVLTCYFHFGIHSVHLTCRPNRILFYFVSPQPLGACYLMHKPQGLPLHMQQSCLSLRGLGQQACITMPSITLGFKQLQLTKMN